MSFLKPANPLLQVVVRNRELERQNETLNIEHTKAVLREWHTEERAKKAEKTFVDFAITSFQRATEAAQTIRTERAEKDTLASKLAITNLMTEELAKIQAASSTQSSLTEQREGDVKPVT